MVFYKIGAKIEKWIFESILSGWKGRVFAISGILAFIFGIIDSLKSDFWSKTFCILVFFVVIFLYRKYSKIFDFIQNSLVTFMFTYGFISVVIIALYYFAIKIGVINLMPGKEQAKSNIELIILAALMFVVLFSFNPTSLIVKGYMQRYDEKWKIYNPTNYSAMFLALSLVFMYISSAWLIWVGYIGVDFPVLEKEYIRINTQVVLMLFAFASYFISFLCSAYLIEKKYLENGVSIGK